jgi:hypothetical protein
VNFPEIAVNGQFRGLADQVPSELPDLPEMDRTGSRIPREVALGIGRSKPSS